MSISKKKEAQKIFQSDLKDILSLAVQLCKKPTAIIRSFDGSFTPLNVGSATWSNAIHGETAFCKSIVQQDDLFIIPDATQDSRVADDQLVASTPHLRFYAGVPLILSNGHKVGALCLFDNKPGHLSALQQKILMILARQTTFFIELEMSRKQLRAEIEEKEAKNESLIKIANLQSHQIRQPLTSIMGLVNLIKAGIQPVDEDWLKMFDNATNDFDNRIRTIVAESMADKDLKAIRFNKMVEEIDDYAILLLDEKGNIENWNKGAELIKGYMFDEIIGQHFSVFYTDADKADDRPHSLLKRAAEKGVARDEGWRVRKDGSKFWGSVIITAIHNENGIVIGFTKVTRNLTEIKDARDAVTASEELYKMITEQTYQVARIGGWELDVTSNVLSWTSVTREIHGVDPQYTPTLADAINFYKEGESREKILRAVQQAIQEGKTWDLELQIVTRQGKETWVRAIGRSNYKNGVCTRIYGTFQDIDIQKSRK